MNKAPYLYHHKEFSHRDFHALKESFWKSFDESTRRHAEKVFLIVYGESRQEITYAKLRQDCFNFSKALLKDDSGVDVVALASTNTYEFVVYILGTLLAGKILYLLDPRENQVYFEKVFKELGKSFVFFAEDLENKPADTKKITLPFDSDTTSPTETRPSENDFIYIRTSGSTGTSKIVRQTEKGVLANVEALIRHHKMIELNPTIATSLPLFHVNALEFSLFCTLMTGSKLVLWKYARFKELGSIIESEKIQIISMVPTQIQQLVKQSEIVLLSEMRSLRYIVSAAAPLSARLVQKVLEIFKIKIIQGYGLSEAVNFSCVIPVDITDETYKKVCLESPYPSIGTAVWGNEVRVVDAQNLETAEGQMGEVAIAGYNLMSGYLNDISLEKQNISAFLTGDRGYYKIFEGEKYFFITGRLKDMAKRNGESVALRDLDDEFQSLLSENFDCIAVAYPHEIYGEEIGMVCRYNDNLQNFSEFKSVLEAIPPHRRPKIVFWNSDLQLRSASGKPVRWKFVSLFSSYGSKRGTSSEFVKVN